MGVEDISLGIILVLFCVALLASFVDVLVGGGGLLTIPALLFAGVPPISALGTNKLQGIAGSGTASLRLLMQGHVKFKDVRWWMLASFFGSALGTVLVQNINTAVLNWLITAVITMIAGYFLFAPKTSEVTHKRLSSRLYGATIVPLIGFYDGMFGPATGSFFVMSGVSLRGFTVVAATMVAKTVNFASNFGGLIVFAWFGKVYWQLGLVMVAGSILGAFLGTKILLTINPNMLRYLIVVMSFTILVAWLYRELT